MSDKVIFSDEALAAIARLLIDAAEDKKR